MDNDARVTIHFSHRIGAVVVLVAALVLIRALWIRGLTQAAGLFTAVLSLQIALGISNVIFHFPIAVAVAHNLVGALLAAVLVFLLYSLITAGQADG